MKTIHVISHTHWDREWYKPFQEFRIRLLQLVDELFEILDSHEKYKYFMLDGQTIVLEDYLEIRPENTAKLERFITSGRILIGPWYILPDEFLVSPESHIRNLLRGKSICARFGNRMMIGYIPDPFGHIGQLPQLLNGFGIYKACFRRGLADEQVELRWKSKDGSEVLTSYLRDGYDNAAWLPLYDPKKHSENSITLIKSLENHSISSHLLFMHGTDHMFPNSNLTSCIEEFNSVGNNDFKMIHSTLPNYFISLDEEINLTQIEIPVIEGELRECKRHELLPAVLSSRMWIKQRNHYCENLLERWVEPFSAWWHVSDQLNRHTENDQKGLIDYCWKTLMQNHPHDSICGCSIDQVHNEMAIRFDQVDQISSQLILLNLKNIASKIDHSKCLLPGEKAIVVFNGSPFPQTNIVEVEIPLPAGWKNMAIYDAENNPLSFDAKCTDPEMIFDFNFDHATLLSSLSALQEGSISGYAIIDAAFNIQEHVAQIHLVLSKTGTLDHVKLQQMQTKVFELLSNPEIISFHIVAFHPRLAEIRFIPIEVPAFGYKTYYGKSCEKQLENLKVIPTNHIENEYYRVTVNNDADSLIIYDKSSQKEYSGIHKIIDGGDVGDEYNYNPPEIDKYYPAILKHFSMDRNNSEESLHLFYDLDIPLSASNDRKTRSIEFVQCPINTTITLTRGVKRIDFHTKVENKAKDHRLRVNFLTGMNSGTYHTDNHFEINERKVQIPTGGSDWIEQPRPEVPQRLFTTVQMDNFGMMLVNKGLPEVQVFKENDFCEIALTLLRCVGWLSRDDLTLRPRGAGPLYPTPGAQMLGSYCFDYSLIPTDGTWKRAIADAMNYDIGFQTIVDHYHEGVFPPINSLLAIDNKDVIITAIKPSEDNNGIIIRGYNPFGSSENVTIKPNFSFSKADLVNLDESHNRHVTRKVNSIELTVKPYQIFSLKFSTRNNELS